MNKVLGVSIRRLAVLAGLVTGVPAVIVCLASCEHKPARPDGGKTTAPIVAAQPDAGPLCPDSNEETVKKTLEAGDPLHEAGKIYKHAVAEGHTRVEALCIAANAIRRYKRVKSVAVADKTLLITYQDGYKGFYLVK